MTIPKVLFGAVLIVVTSLALANVSMLGISSAIYLPFLGVFQIPVLAFGLLGILLTALMFFWAAKASFTQMEAMRVKDLERTIDLQRLLDLSDKQERNKLQTALDAHVNAIMARLETLRSSEKTVLSSNLAISHAATEERLSQVYNRESLPLQNNLHR